MKPDRMTAYEAPRARGVSRPMLDIELRYRGWNRDGTRQTVQIPKNMPPPDLISYKGHTFVRRDVSHYVEASMWPILDELDQET